MEWLVELVKNAPKIIEAASQTELALGALFLLLGAGLVAYMLKGAPARFRFIGVVVWLLVGLGLFLMLIGSRANYRARLDERPAILGKSFKLDLGYLETGISHEATVDLGIERGSVRMGIQSAEAPLTARWASGQASETLTDGSFTKLVVGLPAVEGQGPQSRRVRILSTGLSAAGRAPLDILVIFNSRTPSVPIGKASGPQNSGDGQDFSAPYTVCATVPAEGDYMVDEGTVKVWLTGDRACGAYSTCQPRVEAKSACMIFTLQGHNECGGVLSPCARVRQSEGHVEALARLRRSVPVLSADQS